MKNPASSKSSATSKRLPCSAQVKERVENIMTRVLATRKGLSPVDIMDSFIETYFTFAVYTEEEKRTGNLYSVEATIKFTNGKTRKVELLKPSKQVGVNPFEDLLEDANSSKVATPTSQHASMNVSSRKNQDVKLPPPKADSEQFDGEKHLFSN